MTMTQVELDADVRKRRVRAERLSSPARAIRLLVPVWGERFVRVFLDCSLPTLFAPGNIPALVAALPCRFVVMTRAVDLPMFGDHPAWERLKSLCPVDVKFVDDLIGTTAVNHSTTITLAYQREVEAAGDADRDICFFFLTADYVVADGSLAAVLKRMSAGASGVLATSLQCVDDVLPVLFRQIRCTAAGLQGPQSAIAKFAPRELVSRALEHIHPVATANTVDFMAAHNSHTNKLFWRADPDTLIGRFYLMHMICIRPETDDFVISSSCDYSFIPEMCPSGNVDVMTDSDEYFVIEAQPIDHEQSFLTAGPLLPRVVATSLDEWATAEHRDNARHTIIYHAGPIAPSVSQTIARADAFVANVAALLKPTPVPHRDHPHWRWARAVHKLETGGDLSRADREALDRGRVKEYRGRGGKRLMGFRNALVGTPLDYRSWHPRWVDYAAPLDRLRSIVNPSKRLIILASAPYDLAVWSLQFGSPTLSCPFEGLMGPDDTHRRNAGKFDAAFVILDEDEVKSIDHLRSRLIVMMKSGAPILLVVINPRPRRLRRFNDTVARNIVRLADARLSWVAVHYVPSSQIRVSVQRAMENLSLRAVRHPLSQAFLAIILAPPLALLSLALNLRHRAGSRAGHLPRQCSSVFFELRVADNVDEAAKPQPVPIDTRLPTGVGEGGR